MVFWVVARLSVAYGEDDPRVSCKVLASKVKMSMESSLEVWELSTNNLLREVLYFFLFIFFHGFVCGECLSYLL